MNTFKIPHLFLCFLMLMMISFPATGFGQALTPSDVHTYIQVTTANERSTLDRRTMKITSTADVTLANISSQTLAVPFHGVIEILNATGPVTMPGALGGPGTQPYGKYYYNLSVGGLADGQLTPGEAVTFTVRFVRSSTVTFRYNVIPYGMIQSTNTPPVANAGPDQTAYTAQIVQLNGAGSTDVDGNPLTFSWSFVSRPAGSLAALSDPAAVNPTFIVDRFGNYTVQLIVNDGTVDSAPDTVVISTLNSAPVANAGPDQTIHAGRTVYLNGGGSSDVDGNTLTYAWSFVSRPAGSTAVLHGGDTATPYFTSDEIGDYVIQLIVNDGVVPSSPDTVIISTLNSAPVAEAGYNQNVPIGSTVNLSGTASSDVDGDPLIYAWSFTVRPSSSAATLTNANTATPSFLNDRLGTYVVQLIVNDGWISSAPDTVTVTATNDPPVANAGPDQTAFVNNTVILDGSGSSDINGDPLTYLWSFLSVPGGSSAVLSDPAIIGPTFSVDKPGSYTVQLIVNDGKVDSVPDTVIITTLNSAPVADAGPDQTVHAGDTVNLDGSGSSDVDGNPLTYSWSLASRPAGSAAALLNPTTVNPSFLADRTGSYVVQLIVNDGAVNSAPDTVMVEVSSLPNTPPVANAGPDRTAYVNSTVTLNGSGSSDADGNPLTFAWSFVSRPDGSTATLLNPTAANPTFVVDKFGSYTVQLIVNDGMVNSAPDTVVISTLNSPPVANAGPDQTAYVNSTVTLNGSGSTDVDGNLLSFSWSFVSIPSGSAAILSDPTALNPTFIIDRFGNYTVQLTVNDGTVDSSPDTVVISTLNSVPVANAGPDQAIHAGGLVTLNGSGSSDVDGNSLTYAWSFVSRPEGSAAALSDPTVVNPTFTADEVGDYVIQLVVNDGSVGSVADTITVSTANSKPVADAGADQAVPMNTRVDLSGSGSSDADGDELSYSWSITVRPEGSNATLTNANTSTPNFIPDRAGTYVVQLIVEDGWVSSDPDTLVVTVTNDPPVANAGPDQEGVVGGSLNFNGSGSSDPNGDPLTYAWSVTSVPVGSTATIFNPTSVTPGFTPDRPGTYVIQLIVNDGTANSAPDSLTLTIRVLVPNVVEMTQASATSTLAAAGLTTGAVTQAYSSTITLGSVISQNPAEGTAVSAGTAIALVISLGPPQLVEVPNLVGLTQLEAQAAITAAGLVVGTITIDENSEEPAGTVLSQDPAAGTSVLAGSAVSLVLAQGYETVYVPNVVGMTQAAAESEITGYDLVVGTVTTAYSPTVTAGRVISQIPEAGTLVFPSTAVDMVISLGHTPVVVPNVIGLGRQQARTAIRGAELVVGLMTFKDSASPAGTVITQYPAAGTTVAWKSSVKLVVSSGTPIIPPDPPTVAPPIAITVATTMSKGTEFLYSGSNPIQTLVEEGTIDPVKVAVVRGKVMDRDGNPLSGVVISIFDHLEYGLTVSRADGMFDMAVKGGGFLTIDYRKDGYLPAQRQVNVPWQDYAWLPDVALIPLDTQVTPVNLNTAGMQVARGSVVSDGSGSRQATLLFPQGTQAHLVLPDGSTQQVTTINIRATEYTVGPNGPKAMPAELPPTSFYTYALELSADEALTNGATSVSFNQPLYVYLENFTGFPVGTPVPSAYYDREKAAWVPSENGLVIRILSITSGLADLDTDGDNIIDNGTSIGVTNAERTKLAELYSAGTSLWRVLVNHFSPWDWNWSVDFANGQSEPNPQKSTNKGQPIDDPCQKSGYGSIECQNQVFQESANIVGTPFSLNYASNRVQGHAASNTLEIPLIGDAVPYLLERIELIIDVAGRRFQQTFPPTANQTYTFIWDGKDGYGRTLQGIHQVSIYIGYTYQLCYQMPVSIARSFGIPSGQFLPGCILARQLGTKWQKQTSAISLMDARGFGLAGWTMSPHHIYDPAGRVLYKGDGTQRRADNMNAIITTYAGNPGPCSTWITNPAACGDGGPAVEAPLGNIRAVTADAEGNVYLGFQAYDNNLNGSSGAIIMRVGRDGLIHKLEAGEWSDYPNGMAIGPDGSLYYSDASMAVVRRIFLDGTVKIVAGTLGQHGFSGDGGPAIGAFLYHPFDVAVGPDGSIYIADINNFRVRKVSPDGIINTIAGNGTGTAGVPSYTTEMEGGPALQASIRPQAISLGPDGSLYIGEERYPSRVFRVDQQGIIRTVAGGVGGAYTIIEGIPATEATIQADGLTIGPDSCLYIAEFSGQRVRRVCGDGKIVTVAGSGPIGAFNGGFSGDGGPAAQALLKNPLKVAFGPDGSLYIADTHNGRIRRVGSPLRSFNNNDIAIASEDGNQIYQFDPYGHHLRTINALTGASIYEFGYNSAGLLTGITDGYGNVTTIERDGSGKPTGIRAPFGQRTTLSLNGDGYLSSVTNPAGETTQFGYGTQGLLTGVTGARGSGFTYTMGYDAIGRLISAHDPAGGFSNLSRTDLANGHQVNVTTGMGRTSSYLTETLTNKANHKRNTFQDGTAAESTTGTDGISTVAFPDGTTINTTTGPDPRFGMQAPLTKESSTVTGGLTLNTTNSRSVTLTDPNNLLSLTSLTDTTVINNRTFITAYDALTRTFTSTSPLVRQFTSTINSQGSLLSSQVSGLESTSYSYDNHGRLSAMALGSGGDQRMTSLAYNASGYLESITNPLSQMVRLFYDQAGRITQETFPDSRQVQYGYDAHGNLTSLTTPKLTTHTFTYSPVDLLASYTAPGGTTTGYTYNTDRQLTRIARPEGSFLDFGYDASGRLETVNIPGVGQTIRTYNGTTGQLSTITAADGGTLTFGYGGSLLTSETWAGVLAGTISRTYDNNFRLSSRSVNGGNTVNYQYDNDGLLIGAGNLSLTRNTLNGLFTGSTLGNVTDTWTYNGFGEPTSYTASYGGSPLFGIQYTYDNLEHITQKTETIGAVTNTYQYEYDLAGRLQTVRKNGTLLSNYTYDANGNRLPGNYDDQDRMLAYGSNTYTYTANGELQSKTASGQTTTYQYDALGNLLSVVLPNTNQIQYLVDGLNRRIGKLGNGTLIKGFLFDNQLLPVAELDGSNNPVSIFVYGSRGNVPDYMVKGGVTYRIISDHLGSPRLVVNTATGAIAQRMDYDEFGRVLTDTNPGFQPFGFVGGLYDPDTGLVRFGARDYDAETGRWTTKDPILFEGKDLNLYGYVGNDPVNLSDPPGLGPSIGVGSTLSIVYKNKVYLPRFSPSGQQVGIRIIQRIRPGVWVRPGPVPPGIYTGGLLDSAKTYPLQYSSPTLTRLGWIGKALGIGGKALGYVGLVYSFKQLYDASVQAGMDLGLTEEEARQNVHESIHDPCW